METLDEARRYQKHHPDRINIVREVRYFAEIKGEARYALRHDWTVELLEQKLWMKESNTTEKVMIEA